ncbi:MAG: M20 family metallopeptidase [Planctomycetes bacterium]|nr:M20 family metallopeptidase [Planctomycetota bacterium]
MDTALVGLLRELVGIPSMNPYRRADLPPGYGEAAVVQRVAAFLRDAGLAVELQEIAPGRPNVLARLPSSRSAIGNRQSAILFVAHLDTVPVDGMTIPPFEGAVRDGRLWGRGACDNKGSLAAMLMALRRVAAAKSNPSPILFAGTADEESGYRGIRGALRAEAGRQSAVGSRQPGTAPRAAFVGEPTGLDIIIAHRGVVRWAIEQHGTSAHSAYPERGVNAIYRMTPLLRDLEALAGEIAKRPAHPLVGPPSLSVGTIRGGHSVNTVPDSCAIEVDRRLVPGEPPDAAEAEVWALAERHGAALDRFFCAGAFEVSPDCLAAQMAARAVQAALSRPGFPSSISNRQSAIGNLIGVAYATEAPEVAAAGIPVVVLGPGDGSKAHAADEFLDLDQLQAAEQVYEHLMTQSPEC